MTTKAEIERRLVEKAGQYRNAPDAAPDNTPEYVRFAIARGELIGVALALADAIKQEQEDD